MADDKFVISYYGSSEASAISCGKYAQLINRKFETLMGAFDERFYSNNSEDFNYLRVKIEYAAIIGHIYDKKYDHLITDIEFSDRTVNIILCDRDHPGLYQDAQSVIRLSNIDGRMMFRINRDVPRRRSTKGRRYAIRTTTFSYPSTLAKHIDTIVSEMKRNVMPKS